MSVSPRQPEEEGVLARFLQDYLEDRARGATQALSHYQRRYPGFEALLAEEWRELQTPTPEGSARLDLGGDAAAWLRRGDADQEVHPPKLIGEGGMGRVYRVWDPGLRRYVAKKVLHPSSGVPTDASLQRFVDEAQITGQLGHPGIVPVHQVGVEDDGAVFFTMDLVRGDSFKDVIERVHADGEGDLDGTLPRALDVVRRVCDAVGFAHAKGVLHRDLKPSNLMVGRFGQVYVMDWGLARVLDRPDRRDLRLCEDPMSSVHTTRRDARDADPDTPLVTMDGDVVGTPAYMAPEQAAGHLDRLGPAADVYSLGAILYHLLCGHVPYVPRGARVSSRALLARVVEGAPAPLQRQARGAPPALVAIVERAMAREPEERYASAEELAGDLRAFAERRVVSAYRTGAVAELGQWVGRNRLAAVFAALFIAAAIGGTWWSLRERDRAEQRALEVAEARDQARAEARDARRNFGVAWNAGQKFVDTVMRSDLRSLPGAEPLLAELRGTAQRYLSQIVVGNADDPELGIFLAQGYFKLAMLAHAAAADNAGALASRAIELFEAERGEPRFERPHIFEQLFARYVLAKHYQRIANEAAYESELETLIVDVRREVPLEPSTPVDRLGVSTRVAALTAFASLRKMQRRPEESLALSREALRAARFGTEAHPRQVASWEELALSHKNLATDLRWFRAEGGDVEGHLASAIVAAERGLELAPANRDLRSALGSALCDLGTLRSKGAPAAGQGDLERSLDVLRALADDHPTVGGYLVHLGGACCNLAGVHMREKRYLEGAKLAATGIEPLRTALAMDTEWAANYLQNTYWRGACLWIQAREPERAAAMARGLAADLPGPDNFDRAARLLADCALIAAEPIEATEGFGVEGVAMLRRALEAGFRPTSPLDGERYEFLHGRPGFEEVLELVAAAASDGK